MNTRTPTIRRARPEDEPSVLTLVEPGLVTPFWGDVAFHWLGPLAHDGPIDIKDVPVAVISAAVAGSLVTCGNP